MTNSRIVVALFLVGGFLFAAAAAIPVLRGENLSVALLILAVPLLLIGGILAAKGGDAGGPPPAV